MVVVCTFDKEEDDSPPKEVGNEEEEEEELNPLPLKPNNDVELACVVVEADVKLEDDGPEPEAV